ncbi:MAG: hypothetical protein WCK89_18165, partial [bacterium]
MAMLFSNIDRRLVKLSMAEASRIAESYLKDKGYLITEVTRSPDCVTLRSESSDQNILSLFISGMPQIVYWRFEGAENQTRVQMIFTWFSVYTAGCLFLSALMSFLTIGILFIESSSLLTFFASWGFLMLALVFSYKVPSRNDEELVEGYYLSCKRFKNEDEIVLTGEFPTL